MKIKKLGAKQLRRLIEGVMDQSDEDRNVAVVWGDAACQAIEEHCSDIGNIAALIDDAIAAQGTDAPYPARIEDIEAFTAKAVSYARAEMHLTLEPILEAAIAQAMRRGF